MADEVKIFTKTQLVDKLTELAKKQKEKNDAFIADLNTQHSNEIEKLKKDNEVKLTELQNTISDLTKTLDNLTSKNEELTAELENVKSNPVLNNTDQLFEAAQLFVDKFNIIYAEKTCEDCVDCAVEVKEEKPKKRSKKSKEEKVDVEVKSEVEEQNSVVEEQNTQETVTESAIEEISDIDVDNLLKDL